jgi:hypothetical protein
MQQIRLKVEHEPPLRSNNLRKGIGKQEIKVSRLSERQKFVLLKPQKMQERRMATLQDKIGSDCIKTNEFQFEALKFV